MVDVENLNGLFQLEWFYGSNLKILYGLKHFNLVCNFNQYLHF